MNGEMEVKCVANQEAINQIGTSVASPGHVTLPAEAARCPLCFHFRLLDEQFVVNAGSMSEREKRDDLFVSCVV